jgi:hypothetical protein
LGMDAFAGGRVIGVAKIAANVARAAHSVRNEKGPRCGPFPWAILDSNQGPLPYQRSALTD